MKAYKYKEMVKLLEAEGFHLDSYGEHQIFKNNNNFRIPVPHHREISPGTSRDIFKMIKKSKEYKG